STQLDGVTYTRVHMLCIRAPKGMLPAVSFASLRRNLLSVAHANREHDYVAHDAGDAVTWYVTPAEPDAAYHEDAPDDARAGPDAAVVGKGIGDLLAVYPALREVAEGADSPVRFGVFAGYKQNVGDQPTLPLCDPVDGTSNVYVALPSVLVGAWSN